MEKLSERAAAVYKVDENGIHGFFGEHRFLSNFHLCDIEYQGLVYPSTENAYQAAKCEDREKRKEFVGISPNEAKKLGRIVPMRKHWDLAKIKVMMEINHVKYRDHQDLRLLLLATEGKLLEETNYWNDTYWGVCNGVGSNKLGDVLMYIRHNFLTPNKFYNHI